MTGIPVKRDVAMTGEITLRGRVLPIGGLKEKLPCRAQGRDQDGDHPDENSKDLTEIPDELKNALDIRLGLAHGRGAENRLHPPPQPIAWEEEAEGQPRSFLRRTRRSLA